jgi:hypothetical protein
MNPTRYKLETLCWFVLLFLVSGLVVWVRTSTVKATYEYVQHEKELARLGNEIQGFRIRLLKLTSPKRLESLAKRFELNPPDGNQRIQHFPKGALN